MKTDRHISLQGIYIMSQQRQPKYAKLLNQDPGLQEVCHEDFACDFFSAHMNL